MFCGERLESFQIVVVETLGDLFGTCGTDCNVEIFNISCELLYAVTRPGRPLFVVSAKTWDLSLSLCRRHYRSAIRALTHSLIEESNCPGGSGSPSDDTTNAPSAWRSRGSAARKTQVNNSPPSSSGATTNQRSRVPLPDRRTRAAPCSP